jgi:phosphoribosylamine--glycine ligase
MIKVLLIGDGAREHAIAKTIGDSANNYKLYAISSYRNPGINSIVEKTNGRYFIGNINSIEYVSKILNEVNPDFGIIGPEEPLFHGIANEFTKLGIPVVGPSKECAMIEKSKVWMRELMWKYNIYGRLKFKAFENFDDALKFIMEKSGSIVIKPAEQVGGKGVKVIADLQYYLSKEKKTAASKSLTNIGSLVKGNYKIIIEEKVDGIEYTLHVLTDGKSYLSLPLAQDYKHAYNDGIGPETGGMGSISGPGFLLPFITKDEYEKTFEIIRETKTAIEREVNKEYVGFLSGQMMLTDLWGPTVIEYYSRMGDPETAAILPRIRSDFAYILELAASGHINKVKLEINEKPSIVWAIAPLGYPTNRELSMNKEIELDLKKIEDEGCIVYFGSVALEGMKLITKGSRALEIVALGENHDEIIKKLEKCISYIRANTKLVYRKDIGKNIDYFIKKAEIIRYAYNKRKERNQLGTSKEWYEFV